MHELPLVQTSCSLTGYDRMKRAGEIATLAPDVLEQVRHEDSLTLRFAPDDSIRARIEELIAKESECCPFLIFDLTLTKEAIQLVLSAPKESVETLDRLQHLLAS